MSTGPESVEELHRAVAELERQLRLCEHRAAESAQFTRLLMAKCERISKALERHAVATDELDDSIQAALDSKPSGEPE